MKISAHDLGYGSKTVSTQGKRLAIVNEHGEPGSNVSKLALSKALADTINQREKKLVEAKLLELAQAEQDDQQKMTAEKVKVTNKTQLHVQNIAKQSQLIKQKNILVQEIAALEAIRVGMGSIVNVMPNPGVVNSPEHQSMHKDEMSNNDIFTGELLDQLLSEVAKEEQQLEVACGKNKVLSQLDLLIHAEQPLNASLALYQTRLAEINQEIDGCIAVIADNSDKIKAAQQNITNLNQQKTELVNNHADVQKKYTEDEQALLQHNAMLDTYLHNASLKFNSEYDAKLKVLQAQLKKAEEEFSARKAQAEKNKDQKVKRSEEKLHNRSDHARKTIKKNCHQRVFSHNTKFPKWQNIYKDEWWQEPDHHAINQEINRLENRHNNKKNKIYSAFNNTMHEHNQIIAAARVAANAEENKLATNKAGDLKLILDDIKKEHLKKSEELGAKLNTLKPEVDKAHADIAQKQLEIASRNAEISALQKLVANTQKSKKAAELRQTQCIKDKNSIETHLAELKQKISQIQQSLDGAHVKAVITLVSATASQEWFDSDKYQQILEELVAKRLELSQITQQLFKIKSEIQRLIPQGDNSDVPLIQCVLHECEQALALLLDNIEAQGQLVMIDQKDEHGWTALQCAVARCLDERSEIMLAMIRRLLEAGADIHLTNPEGRKAFEVGLSSAVNQYVLDQALFIYCCQYSLLKIVDENDEKVKMLKKHIQLILDCGPNIDFRDGQSQKTTKELIDQLPAVQRLIELRSEKQDQLQSVEVNRHHFSM